MSCTVSFSPPNPATADPSGTVTSTVTVSSTNASNGFYSCSTTTGTIPPPSSGWLFGAITNWSGPLTVQGISVAGWATCTITPYNEDGGQGPSCSTSPTLTLNPPPRPSCTLGFSPSSVIAEPTNPTQTLLRWTTTNATSGTFTCTGPLPRTNVAVSPLAVGSEWVGFSGVSSPQTEQCTMTVTGPGGTCNSCCTATVLVNPPAPTVVTLAFSPNPAGVLTPVTMSWSGNNTPTSYTLIRVDPPPLATVRSLSTMPLSLTEMPHEIGLIPGVYTFKVEACNDAGCWSTPDPGVTLTVTTASPVGAAWRVKDRLGNVLLTIDSQGNGIAPPPDRLPVFQFAIDNPPVPVPQGAVAGALVLKRRGTNVNVFVFSPAGLYFQGRVLEHQSQATVSAIDGDDLVIRDSGRTPVARFDGATGNLYLRGHAVVGP